MINREIHEKIIFEKECYLIQGAIFEVYKQMGCGFLEAVYQECLEKEFQIREIPFASQHSITLTYKGIQFNQKYIPDFICYDKIIVELKAVQTFAPEHKAQILNYLKATGFSLGLLINFGSHPKAEIIRMANTNFSRFNNQHEDYTHEQTQNSNPRTLPPRTWRR